MKHSPLWQACDEVLHYVWDPIGICGEPGARDEYTGYVPLVVQAIERGGSAEVIEALLTKIASDRMELEASQSAQTTAQTLVQWREWLGTQD